MQDAYIMYQFTYIGHGEGRGKSVKIYARTQDFADKLIDRMNKALGFNFKPKKIGFKKKFISFQPPYEVEQTQERGIEHVEEEARKHEQEQKELRSSN